ncbi:MAG: Na/Pi cotransporter family protein [Firmicutes bacterium]|nr:Na/Pi cotransporter family protein [Bacillota bacterium]
MDQIYNVFLLLGGIGLFLFGINFMTAALEKAAGENLRNVLQSLTNSGVKAVAVGALVTALIQSSGATMVMAAGFVNAQLMTLAQALYVMLGATIGTTITAQIIAFDIAPFAPLILFVGMVLYLFIKRRKVQRIGAIVLGFGVLFTGIFVMGEAVQAMQLGGIVEDFLNEVSNPLLSFLFGFAFAFLIQSSSAAVGILQVIVATSLASGFELSSVVYIVLGMNLGALAPLILSSFGGNKASRRVTVTQVISRLMSIVIFVLAVLIFPGLIRFIAGLSPAVPARQIANLHLIFNLLGSIVMLPLVKPLADFSMRLMPDDPDDEYESKKLIYVTNDLRKGHIAMVAQAKMELIRFGTLCINNLNMAIDSFFDKEKSYTEKVIERENTLNYLNHELNAYLVKVYAEDLSLKDHEAISLMFNVLSDFERIADHAENITEYEIEITDNKVHLSGAGIADLRKMAKSSAEAVNTALRCFVHKDMSLYYETERLEQLCDDLNDECVNNHIERLKQGICEPRGGVIYTDMINDLERCADHAMNIAESILGIDAPVEQHQDIRKRPIAV